MKPIHRLIIWLLWLTVAALQVVNFLLNWPESYNDSSLFFAVLYFVSLLSLSFAHGESKRYLIGISVLFVLLLLIIGLGTVFKGTIPIIIYLWVFVPVSAVISPLAPFYDLLPFRAEIEDVFLLMLVAYGLVFSAHRLGGRWMAKRNVVKAE